VRIPPNVSRYALAERPDQFQSRLGDVRSADRFNAPSPPRLRMNGWSAAATFEGEFSDVTRSYAGKGVVRYTW
jgi:hypothetical protein